MPRLGVVGALVWDEIHGRDPARPVTEEWGGIAYALAGLDAALADGWTLVPLLRVGADRAREAAALLGTLRHVAPATRAITVPAPTARVVLRYRDAERRCEGARGGAPPWTWPELGPLVADCDALYLNFVTGDELALDTARALRQAFAGPIYCDLHSLLGGRGGPGALAAAPAWFGVADVVQLNEDEMRQLGPDPLAVASVALAAGAQALVVTLGARGAAYVEAPRGAARPTRGFAGVGATDTVRTARVPAPAVDAVDATGCGDVFGAACCARLAAGAPLPDAMAAAGRLAARNATLRGATGLAAALRGALVLPAGAA